MRNARRWFAVVSFEYRFGLAGKKIEGEAEGCASQSNNGGCLKGLFARQELTRRHEWLVTVSGC